MSELQSHDNLVCRLIRSEEHTSELQSHDNLVCRLLLEKKKRIEAVWGARVANGGEGERRMVVATTRAPHTQSASPLSRHRSAGPPRTPFLFFFNERRPPEISPLPLHAALPI